MKKLKELAFTFSCVTTCTLIGSAIYISIFCKDALLDVYILWQILGCSFLCTLGNFLYINKEKSKSRYYTIIGIHYLYVNVVVLSCGILFEWFSLDNLMMVIAMLLMIAMIFIFIACLLQIRLKKHTDLMNQKLKEYVKKRNIN